MAMEAIQGIDPFFGPIIRSSGASPAVALYRPPAGSIPDSSDSSTFDHSSWSLRPSKPGKGVRGSLLLYALGHSRGDIVSSPHQTSTSTVIEETEGFRNDPEADLHLIASDGVIFHVHSRLVSETRSVRSLTTGSGFAHTDAQYLLCRKNLLGVTHPRTHSLFAASHSPTPLPRFSDPISISSPLPCHAIPCQPSQ